VGDNFLAQLDCFEGHPHLYQRDVISVRVIFREHNMTGSSKKKETEKQEIVNCNTYLKKDFDEDLLEKDTYSSYHSEGSHGLPYLKEYVTFNISAAVLH